MTHWLCVAILLGKTSIAPAWTWWSTQYAKKPWRKYVAQDTQDGLKGSDSDLYIGCGKAMEPGTFFSGLIDDVRIYNRVVIP